MTAHRTRRPPVDPALARRLVRAERQLRTARRRLLAATLRRAASLSWEGRHAEVAELLVTAAGLNAEDASDWRPRR